MTLIEADAKRADSTRARVRRVTTWRFTAARTFVYSLVAFQIVHAVWTRPSLVDYIRSYWAITYRHGFVRRGLTGSALEWLTGPPSVATIERAAFVVSALAIVSVIVLVELLLRRRTAETVSLAVLLACSPFGIEYLAFQRRPDVLAVPILVAFGIGLLHEPRYRRALCIGAGSALALLTFVHEAVVLETLPWLAATVVVVLASGRASVAIEPQERLRLLALLAAPAGLTLLIVACFGTPTPDQVDALRADAHRFQWPRETTMFDVLIDDLADSFHRVRDIPVGSMIATLVFGSLLLAVHAMWLSRSVRYTLFPDLLRRGLVGGGCVVAIGFATVFMFVTGLDWLRWVTAFGFAWLVTAAFCVLARSHDSARAAPLVVDVPRWVPVLAIYLALLCPMIEMLTPGQAPRFLVLGS